MKKIEFTDSEALELIPFYQEKLEEILSKKKRYEQLLQTLRNSLNANSSSKQLFFDSVAGYSADWSWTDKIKFVLEESGRVLKTKDIIDRLLNYDPDLGGDRLEVTKRSSSATVSRQTKNGVFGKSEDKDGISKYGLSEWFENGKLKENFI